MPFITTSRTATQGIHRLPCRHRRFESGYLGNEEPFKKRQASVTVFYVSDIHAGAMKHKS